MGAAKAWLSSRHVNQPISNANTLRHVISPGGVADSAVAVPAVPAMVTVAMVSVVMAAMLLMIEIVPVAVVLSLLVAV